jgi:hypothetical protein
MANSPHKVSLPLLMLLQITGNWPERLAAKPPAIKTPPSHSKSGSQGTYISYDPIILIIP